MSTTVEYSEEERERLVVQAIVENCSPDSSHADLRTVAAAVSAGHKLKLKVITGGFMNYSYEVSIPSDPNAAPFFAKLALPYVLMLGPDTPFPTERLQNEYDSLTVYQSTVPESQQKNAITPYFCVDVKETKLLVTQWSHVDEQFGNQFIDGCVDLRVA